VITVEEFRERIRRNEVEFLLDTVLVGNGATHVSIPDIEHIRATLSAKFDVPANLIDVWIVGSAKIGFAITEKRLPSGVVLPRYRQFSAHSDIDVAVVSPALFDLVWNELSTYAHRVARLPWNSGLLGDYLVCGWLRPDHFPMVRLRRCDDWWDLFRFLSADTRYGRRRVRGGLFHSLAHMKRYQARALNECVIAESLTI
jgi:hypothetical protein